MVLQKNNLPKAAIKSKGPKYVPISKRGDKPEWEHTQDYWREKDELPKIDLDGPEFVYE